MKSYYISKQGQQLGPWTHQEVLNSIAQKELGVSDYVYSESKSDWVLLVQHEDFSSCFAKDSGVASIAQVRPAAPTVKLSEGKKDEWFVLKGENKYGPFSYLEMIRLLQEKNLYEFDYVWSSNHSDWNRVSECSEFHPEKIKALKNGSDADSSDIFFRRRHARASYGASVLVHNNKTVWKGHSLEISAGGAGLLLDNSVLEPGQTVFLHFKVGDEVPPFNAVCSIVSKQISAGGESVKYGVKFTNINREVQHAIKTYTAKVA